MLRWPDGGEWTSAHLFRPGELYGAAFDRVVLEQLAPLVHTCRERGWIDGWFFVRYPEGGAHLRLRMRGRAEVLAREVRPAVEEAFGPGARWVAYVPETDRYGGPEGTALAEHFFQLSSEAALLLLARTDSARRSSRLGKGLLAMAALLHAFRPGREEAADFARRYGTGYLRAVAHEQGGREGLLDAFGKGYEQQAEALAGSVDEVWERLEEGNPVSGALDRYHAGACGIRGRLWELAASGTLRKEGRVLRLREEAVGAIVPSYLHMMNNRLGITLREEAYLAYVMARALGEPVEACG